MDNFYARYPVSSGGGSGVTSLNTLVGALTLVAGSGITIIPAGSNITIAATGIGATNKKDLYVLTSTDITNQYVDLTHTASVDSITFSVQGEGAQIEGASYDYSVSYSGGAGGVSRVSFLNGLATGGVSALVAGDVIVIKYQY